jgi:hypothetical protein
MSTLDPIDCPKCGAPMKLIGILPRIGVHDELRTFKCDAGRRIETRVVDATARQV